MKGVGATMRRVGWIGLALAAALLIPWLTMGSASAASHYIQMTITASPNPAPGTTVVLFTGTVTPVGGPFYGVVVEMSPVNGGACHARCEWSIPTLNSKMTFRVYDSSFGTPRKVTITVTACQPNDCMVVPATVTVQGPTDSMGLTYSPSGAISPGEHLHFTIRGSTNVGPVSADLQTKFLSGLAAPTNLSPGAQWSGPPYGYIDDGATLNRSSTYSFDSVVTAHVGGSVKVLLTPFNDPIANASGLPKTVILHVGPVPTPRPRPTPVPTHSPRPTAAPSLAAVTAAPSIDASLAPIPAASIPDASGPISAAPTDSTVAIIATSSSPGGSAVATAIGPSAGPPGPPGVVVVAALGSVTALAVAGLFATGRVRRPH
jgi:hypothetical protein